MRPIIRVSIGDDDDITDRLGGRVLKGQIVEVEGGEADSLALTLSNYDGLLAKPRKGARLTVSLGWEGGPVVKVGEFIVQEVTKVGAQAMFEIGAKAADLNGTLKQQKTRSFLDKSLGEVIEQLAADNGLQAAVAPVFKQIKANFYQTGVSDAHFMTDLARRYGAIGKVADGRMVFAEQGAGETTGGQMMPEMVVTPNDLEGDFRIADRDRPNRGKVKGRYMDRAKGERQEEVAGDGDGPEYVFPQLFGSQAEAKAAVSARKREFDSETKTFTGTLRSGSTDAKAGGRLRSNGFGDDDDHGWVYSRVVHDFNQNGWVIPFEAKPPKTKPKAQARAGAKASASPSTARVREAGAVPSSPIG